MYKRQSYAFVQSTETADVIFVSHALSQRYGKTVEKDGSASILFADESRVSEDCRDVYKRQAFGDYYAGASLISCFQFCFLGNWEQVNFTLLFLRW